jgi:hypothetical protein
MLFFKLKKKSTYKNINNMFFKFKYFIENLKIGKTDQYY